MYGIGLRNVQQTASDAGVHTANWAKKSIQLQPKKANVLKLSHKHIPSMSAHGADPAAARELPTALETVQLLTGASAAQLMTGERSHVAVLVT